MDWSITGLHHVTLVTRRYLDNRWFYTEVMGLRLVKLTVNQDDIYHRHLFYADKYGNPGSSITFFEWPSLPRGEPGIGSPHHLAYRVRGIEALLKWRSYLSSLSIPVKGPYLHGGEASIYLRDVDGALIELICKVDDVDERYISEEIMNVEAKHVDDDMRLLRLDHASPIATDAELVSKFFEKVLGLNSRKTRDSGTTILAIGDESAFLKYLIAKEYREGIVGTGSIHHVAMLVNDEDELRSIANRLRRLGIANSGIVDRFWFKSLYFRDIEGNLLEVATKGPGYTVDENIENLGSRLSLPSWLEPMRYRIEERLRELDSTNTGGGERRYGDIPDYPETLL